MKSPVPPPNVSATPLSVNRASAESWKHELVSRVVKSETFARSVRLSSLLQYICEMTLKGRESEINEQKIGQAVFGRPRDYDSTADGIVRTQASRLRHRLDLYYRQEGAAERVRIVVPRGGYVPVFEPQAEDPVPMALPEALPATKQAEAFPASASSRFAALPWILVVLLGSCLVTLALMDRGILSISAGRRPSSHPLWGQLFSANKPTLLVTADSGLVMFQGLAKRKVSLDDYLLGDYRSPGRAPTPQQVIAADFSSRRYTSIVDLQIAQELTQMALSGGAKLQVKFPRDLRPNDLKAGNTILLGAAEADPWVEIYEHNMNFVFNNDLHGIYSVINTSPQGDEAAKWDSALADPQHHVYGVVAFLPNFSGNGNTLILEGTSMAGTESAWDFVSDDAQLLPFLKKIRRPDGSVPHFELVLGTNNMGASAVRSTVLAWRIVR